MHVTPRDLDVAHIKWRGRVAQEVGDVVFVDVRRAKPRGEALTQNP